jgi:hypothetical protein
MYCTATHHPFEVVTVHQRTKPSALLIIPTTLLVIPTALLVRFTMLLVRFTMLLVKSTTHCLVEQIENIAQIRPTCVPTCAPWLPVTKSFHIVQDDLLIDMLSMYLLNGLNLIKLVKQNDIDSPYYSHHSQILYNTFSTQYLIYTYPCILTTLV